MSFWLMGKEEGRRCLLAADLPPILLAVPAMILAVMFHPGPGESRIPWTAALIIFILGFGLSVAAFAGHVIFKLRAFRRIGYIGLSAMLFGFAGLLLLTLF